MDSTVRILIADDDAEDRFIFIESMEESGFSGIIESVEDGAKALSHLESAEPQSLPALILLDLNMPRLNGTETLRKLKSHPQLNDIPVIIFSTSVNNIEKEECMKLGAASYVIKPGTYTEALAIARYFCEFAVNVAAQGTGA